MTPAPSPEPFTHRQIVIILSGLMAGLFLAALDQTIVATALPTIVGELGGLDYYSWVVTAYLLCATVCTPLYGKLSDIYGRRVTFQAAILIFLLGSVLAGLAPGMLALVLSRGVQGVGAGGVMGLTFAVVGDIVSPRQRGRYIGYLAGVWAFASVIGPLLGGFIVDQTTWRWVFLINLPVGGAALAVIWVVLRLPPVHRPARIDFAGAALLMAGVSLLLLALVRVQEGGAQAWDAAAAGLTAAGAALIAAFIRWEAHVEHPLLPLRLFRNRIFAIGSGLALLIGCALFGGVIFLPLFLQVVAGLSATNSGLLLLPLTAGVLVGSVGSGRLTSRTGRYRIYPIAGSACAVGGMFLLSRLHAGRAHSRFPGAVCRQRWTVRLGEVEPVFGQTGRVVLDITARTAHDGALKWTRAPSTPRAARSIFATFPSTCALPSGGRWSLRRVLQRPRRQRKRSSAKSSCGPSRTSSSAPSSPPCCNARCAPPRLATRRAPSCATCPGGCGATAWRPSTFAPPGARRCRSRRRTTARNTPVGRSGGRDSTP